MAYLARKGKDLAFSRYFWKACEPNSDDIARYSRFVEAISLHERGFTSSQIAVAIHVGRTSVESWLHARRNSKLSDYLRAYLRLGRPKPGWVWLSVNNTPGRAIPLGPFIQVPVSVKKWKDGREVLEQLKPIRRIPAQFSCNYRFGFLLGVMIGDAGKKRQAHWHRHLELVLSQKYRTNERIGNFTAECAMAFGIRMRRMSDQRAYGTKPHGFYVWESQSSGLVDWLFNACLGLMDGELTTYNPVRMEWSLNSPKDFRQGLVQGMAESDGSVNIASQAVEFWIGPNWNFVKRLLLTFGVRSFKSRQALCVSKREIRNLHGVPAFAPNLKTVRYEKFEKLAGAKHISRGARLPLAIRESIALARRRGLSIPQISEHILDNHGLALSFEAVQRWASRAIPE